MTQLMIEVPEDLAVRLKPVQTRLPDILERGLRQYLSDEYLLPNELAEFLASGPSPQELVRFHPSSTMIDRMNELLEKNREGSLTQIEQSELDQIEVIDYLMTQVKARARLRLAVAA